VVSRLSKRLSCVPDQDYRQEPMQLYSLPSS
jgi:hypothetical protein